MRPVGITLMFKMNIVNPNDVHFEHRSTWSAKMDRAKPEHSTPGIAEAEARALSLIVECLSDGRSIDRALEDEPGLIAQLLVEARRQP